MTRDAGPYPRSNRRARVREPLDPATLEELALGYVARFATSGKGLERYCRRKLRERGWAGADGEGDPAGPAIEALVARFVERRFVDDEAFARSRSGGLLRRGYGARRIGAALDAAGIADEDRAGIGEGEARMAAFRLARKRRFGPFGAGGAPVADKALRDRQIAAMLRAGHPLDNARELVDAPDTEAALAWAQAFEQES